MTCIAIDDEPLALEIIRNYAADTPLINLINTFTDAIQALAFLKAQKVDLIILDIQMPDISGIQFYNSLQENQWSYSPQPLQNTRLKALNLRPSTIL